MQENTDQNDSEYRHFSGSVFQPAKVSRTDNAVEALLGKYRKRIVEVLRETLALPCSNLKFHWHFEVVLFDMMLQQVF